MVPDKEIKKDEKLNKETNNTKTNNNVQHNTKSEIIIENVNSTENTNNSEDNIVNNNTNMSNNNAVKNIVENKEEKPKIEDNKENNNEKQIQSEIRKDNVHQLPTVNKSDTGVTVYNDYEKNRTDSETKTISLVSIIVLLFIVLLLLAFSIFTVYNTTSKTIANGVFIKGVDVSGLSKESALNTINTFINEHISEEIVLKHNDYEASILLTQIEAKFDIESAINEAYSLTRDGNIFENSFIALKLLFVPTDITPTFSCNDEQLKNDLSDISSNLPDTIVESSYYVEDTNLVATKGHSGYVVDVDNMANFVKQQIEDLNFKGKTLNLITIEKSPSKLDINKIYSEIHKEAKDAYFTQNPYALYPSETGVDFAISLEEAKALIDNNDEEVRIPLKILYPNVTTEMLGNEAFPNELSTFSTYYVNNANRTTNLVIASNKINGTIVMPGETFSFNKVVGERTIAEGYKNAAIYVNGQTVDGLAGGICQVSTTLYQSALYANLEIVERRNHQFVPSYIGAGLDATVVYGLTDFKFKNNRNYPIKILCSVSGGVCSFRILGLATADDYEVSISASSSTTSTSINAVTYKTLKKDGVVISSEIISRDTYKRH